MKIVQPLPSVAVAQRLGVDVG